MHDIFRAARLLLPRLLPLHNPDLDGCSALFRRTDVISDGMVHHRGSQRSIGIQPVERRSPVLLTSTLTSGPPSEKSFGCILTAEGGGTHTRMHANANQWGNLQPGQLLSNFFPA